MQARMPSQAKDASKNAKLRSMQARNTLYVPFAYLT
jgi:hypothetical protein